MQLMMSKNELHDNIDLNVKGTTMVSLVTETPVRMLKKHRDTGEPNPYLGATKIQKKNGIIGFDYGNSVNNQAEREDKVHRMSKRRTWGTLSDNRIWVYHKGEVYLQVKIQSVADTKYMLDGIEVDYEKIRQYMSERKKSSTQDDLEKAIIVNDIKIRNIKKIVLFKNTITLKE